MNAHQHSGSCIRRQKLYQNPFRTGSCRSLQPPRATRTSIQRMPENLHSITAEVSTVVWYAAAPEDYPQQRVSGPYRRLSRPQGLSLSGELYICDSPAVFLPSLMMGNDADVQQHNGESTRVDVTWTLRNVRKVEGGYGQSTRYRGGISSGVLCPGGVHRSYPSSRGKTPKMRFMPLR